MIHAIATLMLLGCPPQAFVAPQQFSSCHVQQQAFVQSYAVMPRQFAVQQYVMPQQFAVQQYAIQQQPVLAVKAHHAPVLRFRAGTTVQRSRTVTRTR